MTSRPSQTFTYSFGGKDRQGTFETFGSVHPRIRVRTEFGEKTTQLGWTAAEVLARMIAGELAREFKE